MKLFNHLIILLLILIVQPYTNYSQTNSDETTVQKSQSDAPAKQSDITSSVSDNLQKSAPQVSWGISVGKIFWSFVLIFIALLAIKYISKILEILGERWANLRLLIKRIIPILRISTWTLVIYIVIAGILKPPIETIIAVTASAGIAVGFASQDILKNIFGGIMILFDRPFQVGDKIQVGEFYGEVLQIGLRTVRIVTADDSMISIPNSVIVNQSVSNSNSGEFNCQVVAEFYLPVGIDLARLKKIAYLAASVSRYIYLSKPIAVIIKNEIHQGRSLLKMRLKAYVLDLRYEFAFASELTEFVIKQLLKEKLIVPDALDQLKPL